VLLGAMLLVGFGFAVTLAEGATDAGPAGPAAGEHAVRVVRITKLFKPTEPSWIASSPTVDGDRLFVGVVHGTAFRSGALYCLDRATGRQRWMFNDGGAMKQIFSTPCVADGRVYVGEGFHVDPVCKLYCLDAETGRK